jgi:hemerythrin-like domain-containing protein
MTEPHESRRHFLLAAGTAGAGLLLATSGPGAAYADEKEVGAVEDLMREHGVLRRALLVYAETAAKLRAPKADVDPAALHDTAKLFRTFGEDYHERQLEEAHIFPVVKKAGGPAAAYPDILTAQHNRGREITDYVLSVTGKGKIAAAQRAPLAHVFETFVAMYENHAAREDTIVFPAWKDALSEKQIDELGDQFEEIEHRMFGKDGFEDAVKKIAAVEQRLGYADLAQFTAPPPPHA